MRKIEALEELQEFYQDQKLGLLLFSAEDCGLCTVIKMRLEAMLKEFEQVAGAHVRVDELIEARGEFMVFAVPTVVLFSEGRELVRESQFVMFHNLEKHMKRHIEQLAE